MWSSLTRKNLSESFSFVPIFEKEIVNYNRQEIFKVFEIFLKMNEPSWANLSYKKIDLQKISYYSAPKTKKKLTHFEAQGWFPIDSSRNFFVVTELFFNVLWITGLGCFDLEQPKHPGCPTSMQYSMCFT